VHRLLYRPDSSWFFIVGVVKIALGVFIGCMMSFFAYEALLEHRLKGALAQIGAQHGFTSDAINSATAVRNKVVVPGREAERTRESNAPASQGLENRIQRERQQRSSER
jgi:hypothetical protein